MTFLQLFYTTFTTVLAGTFVYVFSKLIERFLIEPIAMLKATIRKTESYLILYGNVYDVKNYDKDYLNNISFEYRNLAASLVSDLSAIPIYEILRKYFIYH
jgi:hypothetical protein